MRQNAFIIFRRFLKAFCLKFALFLKVFSHPFKNNNSHYFKKPFRYLVSNEAK